MTNPVPVPSAVYCTCTWALSDAQTCRFSSDGTIGPGGETICGRCLDHYLSVGCSCDCDGCCITVSPPQKREHDRLVAEFLFGEPDVDGDGTAVASGEGGGGDVTQ